MPEPPQEDGPTGPGGTADAATAPNVTTVVVPNDRGTEDVHLQAGGIDGVSLAKAIEAEFNRILKEHMRRPEFSGHVQVVVLEMTPRSERKHLHPVIERLQGICAELTTREARYRVTIKYQTSSASTASTPPSSSSAIESNLTMRASGNLNARLWFQIGVALILLVAVGYWWYTSPASFTFPDRIAYGEERLTRATSWTRDGISGAVFLKDGEKLPSAELQIGVMVSAARPTAEALDAWIREQYAKSRTQTFYDSGEGEETCKAGLSSGRDDVRAFMAVQRCKTGNGRAACAEDDEPIPQSVLAPCANSATNACWEEACTRRRRDEREALDTLINQALTLD